MAVVRTAVPFWGQNGQTIARLGLQPRFGDELLIITLRFGGVCPQNETEVLEELREGFSA